jgi:23S rRNA pseudouridine2457 synthase
MAHRPSTSTRQTPRDAPRPGTSRYFLLHKPYGTLCQFTDQAGRPTLKDLFPIPGMYACGRLDTDSEGLLLLTDDGAFQARIAHPDSKLWKTYLVQVEGIPSPQALDRFRQGVTIEGRATLPARARLLDPQPDIPPRDPPIRVRREIPDRWIEVQLREGRNRQVRRMTAAVGHPTLRLVRTAIGDFSLEGLAPGEWREIRPDRR